MRSCLSITFFCRRAVGGMGWRALAAAWLAGVTMLPALTPTPAPAPAQAQVEVEPGANPEPRRLTLRAGLPTDLYPISFLDAEGRPTGFAVEVLRAAAQDADLEIEEKPMPTEEVEVSFRSDLLDLRPFISQSLTNHGTSSVPYMEMEGAIFARPAGSPVLSVDSPKLKTARIAVIPGWGRKYALRYGVPDGQIAVLSPEEALRSVATGANDLALMPRLVGLAVLPRLNVNGKVALLAPLPKDYTRRCGFSLLHGEHEALARLNDALVAMRDDGRLKVIRHKWFGNYELQRLSPGQVLLLVITGLALLLALTWWGLQRQRRLSRAVARQAEELGESHAILAVAQRIAGVGHWQRKLDETDTLVCSDELCRILGVRPGEVETTMTWFMALVHPDDRAGLRAALGNALHGSRHGTKRPVVLTHRLVLPASGERFVEHCVQLLNAGAPEKHQSLVGTLQDITGRKLAEEHRLNQERVMQEAGQIAKVGGWSYNPFTGVGHWTEEVAHIHDMAADQPTSRDLGLSFFQGEHRARLEAAVREAELHGTPYDLEMEMITATGRFKWVRSICNPVVENGVVTRVRGCLQDITARKRTEADLQASHDLLAKLSANVPGLIFQMKMTPDGHTSMPFASKSLEIVAGVPPDHVTEDTAPAFSRIHPEDLPRVQAAIQDSARHLTRLRCEYRVVLPQAGERWHFTDAQPESAPGNCILWHGYVTDVTERRYIETRLAQQAALLDQARDAIMVRDMEQRVLFWNHGAEALYGWTREQAIGRPIFELFTADDKSTYDNALAALLEHGEWAGELVLHPAKSDHEVTVSSRWTLVRDDSGQPFSVLSISTDITEKKRLEAQFLRAQRLESIGTLASGLAHDLNNVLAPITLAVSLIRTRHNDPMTLKTLDLVEASAQRGAGVVGQILGFARGTKVQRVPMRIETVVNEQLTICNSSFPKSITVHTRLPARGWVLQGDATQLAQVLMNLCVNARDAMPQGGHLTMAVQDLWLDATSLAHQPGAAPGPYVLLEVTDDGEGIPPEIITRIFDPFYTSKDIGRGSGLGLSTVLAIVRGHGGFVDVTSQVGQGTTFHVYLPAAPAADTQAAAPPEPPPLDRPARQRRNPPAGGRRTRAARPHRRAAHQPRLRSAHRQQRHRGRGRLRH